MCGQSVSPGGLLERSRELLLTIGKGRGGWRAPKAPCLLVLDMQRFFLDRESHAFVPGGVEIASNVRLLAELFSSRGLPVIYTRHGAVEGEEGLMASWWNDTLYRGEERWEIHPSALPGEGGEKITLLDKSRYSAFHGTGLEELLRGWGVEDVILAGVVSHLCVETTARDAFVRDFRVWTVVDAVADWREDMHISSLRALADGFSMLTHTDEVREWLEDENGPRRDGDV